MVAAARGDLVVFPRRNAGLHLAPGARDEPFAFERVESGVDVAFGQQERALRALADLRDDLVSVALLLAHELEDREARAALADLLRPAVDILCHGGTYRR